MQLLGIPVTYKGHAIIRTETRKADSLRPLYRIEGRYNKQAGERPFLTSQREAKDWIDEQITADEMVGK